MKLKRKATWLRREETWVIAASEYYGRMVTEWSESTLEQMLPKGLMTGWGMGFLAATWLVHFPSEEKLI